MRRSSWPSGLSDELAAQHPRSTFWHPQVGMAALPLDNAVTVAAEVAVADR
jgi:hypothetical protein